MRNRQVDDFSDLRELRAQAQTRATHLGHTLRKFVVRRNDPTKADAFCATCNALAVINTDPDRHLPAAYGHALTDRCGNGTRRTA